MLCDPFAKMTTAELDTRLRFEAKVNALDVGLIAIGCLGLMAGLRGAVIALAGFHLLAGLAITFNRPVWVAQELVLLTLGTAVLSWMSGALAGAGVDFLAVFFTDPSWVVRAAAASLVMALLSHALNFYGYLDTARRLEVLKRHAATSFGKCRA